MKTSEANIEDLRNQTVSWGTHRPDDLIPKFMAVLKEYGKEAYDKYVSENPEVEDWKKLDDETKGWVVDELFDLLDGIAPEDCYFGAHPGDGADFGFWQVDESKRKESKKKETNSPEEEAVKKVLMDASADAEFRREAGKDFSAEDFEKSIDANIEKLRDVFLEVLYFDDGSFKCDVNDHEETRELCSFVASKVAYILGLSDSVATAIDGYLLWYVVQENIVSDESKKSEKGNKDIFTLDLTRIDAEGDEEGLDDMQAAQNFYDEDEAIQAAKDLADSYKDDDDVVQVTVMAGEQEKPNGDIVGEPFDIFTASSSDSATTAKYREKAGYAKTDGLDYYAKGGKSEAKKSEARPTKQDAQIKELCKLCRNDKNVADSVFKALTKDYNTSLDPVLAGQYLMATWKSKLEELGGCNGWYDGFKKLYAAMGSDFVCSVLQDLKLGSSEIGCGACITIVDAIYDKVVKRNEAKKSESKKNEDTLYMGCHGFFTKDGKTYVIEDESPEWDGEIVGKWSKSDWERIDTDKVIKEWRKDHPTKSFGESKKSESLTLKQKELKNMVRYGEATDITTISDAEAKELKKKGIETVGISRGAYGMNGALLRDNEGNKYVITARSSNLFYFV